MERVGVLRVQIGEREVNSDAEIDLAPPAHIVQEVHALCNSGPSEVNRHFVSFLAWIARRRIKLKIGPNDLPIALDHLLKRKGYSA